MPNAFIYLRVSTLDQADSGLGLQAQEAACRRYFELELAPRGFTLHGVYRDRAVSGKKPFLQREAGGALDGGMRKGDALVIAKTDRAFRSLADTVLTLDLWRRRGCEVCLLDVKIDTASPAGRLLIGVLAMFAEFERERISERTREGLRERTRTKGMHASTNAPRGYKWNRSGPGKTLLPWPQERELMGYILRLHDEEGLSYDDVWWRLLREGRLNLRTGRPPLDRFWCWHMGEGERKIRARLAADPTCLGLPEKYRALLPAQKTGPAGVATPAGPDSQSPVSRSK